MQTASNISNKDSYNKTVSADLKTREKSVQLSEENVTAEIGVPLFMHRWSADVPPSTVQRKPLEEGESLEKPVHPKLTVGAPDDEYEREADSVADTVMRTPEKVEPPKRSEADYQRGGIQVRRSCNENKRNCCKRVPEIQAKSKESSSDSSRVYSPMISTGGGSPMPLHIRSRIEGVIGSDLSHIRVHSDKKANTAAVSIQAQAFTHGNDIFLGKGQRVDNLRLMAHESAHVLQQGSADIQRYAPEDVLRSSITEGFAQALSDEDVRLAYGLAVSALASSSSDNPEHEALTSNRTILAAEATARGIDLAEHRELSQNPMDAENSIPIIFEAEEITPFDISGAFGDGEPTSDRPAIPELVLPTGSGVISEDDPGSYGLPGISSFGVTTGMSSHMLAMGEHAARGADGNLMTLFGSQTGRGAFGQTLRGMTSRQYWGSFMPRPGTIELERVLNQVPRDLDPYYSEVRAGRPSPGYGRDIRNVANVTDDQLATFPRLIRQYNAGTISAAERNLLMELARYHANGTPRSSPLVSYMVPGETVPPVGNRLFRVRIRVPANQALNNLAINPREFEFLLSMDHDGRLTQVSSGTQLMNDATSSRTTQFLTRHGNKIRWAGRIAFVASAAYGGYRVATASEEQRGRVAGEEIGSLALGAAGTVLAGAGCVALGIATGGIGLFVCGLVGGVAMGALGRYAGGEVGDTLQHNPLAPAQWVVNHAVRAVTDPMIESGDPVRRADGVALRRVIYQDDPMSLMHLMNRMCGGCISMPRF